MALIGDILFRVRSKIPDMPLTLPAPGYAPSVVASIGSTLGIGTYFVVVTQRNAWGETLGTESTVLNVAANQGINIVSGFLPGCTTIRVYLTLAGGVSGSELAFMESTATSFTISAFPTSAGSPPTRSTAYMMDGDGIQFGASTLYDWLNDALVNLSRAVGGVLDYCGVPTVVGQPLYVMPGEWVEISDVWYNGYWVQGGKRGDFFRRDQVTTSILNNVAVSVFTEKQVLEVSHQPDRNAGATTTSANMAATDTSVAIANTGAFLLPFGFAQIGSEIVAYSQHSPTLAGLIRGLGSTVAQAWPSGTVVTELNLFWCGKRLFTTKYSPGQATTQLAVPVGWESIVPMYMLGLAKDAELDTAEGEKKKQQAIQMAKDWMTGNRLVQRFMQVGGYGSQNTAQAFNPTIAGGVIVP